MRTLGTQALVSALVLTAMLGGACQVQPDGDTVPAEADPRAAGQPESPGDATTAAARPSPTPVPSATQPAAEPSTGQPSDGDGPAGSAQPEPASDPQQPAAADQAGDPEGRIEDQPAAQRDPEADGTGADTAEPERLPAGLEAALRTSFPDAAFVLHPEAARGDLNGDGSEDIVVHVEARSGDSPQPHLLVPVIDTGGAYDVQAPIELGRRVIIDAIGIRDGAIEVSLFDRSPGEPLTVITRRTTLSISPDSAEAAGRAATVTRVEPIDAAPTLHVTRPATAMAFELDGLGAAVSDRIKLRERHRYVVHAAENDVMVATLAAPAGVWLEARLGTAPALVPMAERTQRFAVRAPASGAWSVTVASALPEPADYRLSVEVFPPGLGDHVDTRGPDDFWSGTHMSPPALPDEGPVVYLTFDDGPHPVYTPQILDVLARHGAKATFFVVGYIAERYPLIVQRIAHEGHTLANHSWDHHSLARLSRAAFDRSVERTQEVLGPLATPCLRPPYWDLGRYTEQWSNDLGLKLVGWSYTPSDWEQPPAKTIADGVVARTSPGAVILLHDGGGPRSATVRGLDMALERLADRGLDFKPLCR